MACIGGGGVWVYMCVYMCVCLHVHMETTGQPLGLFLRPCLPFLDRALPSKLSELPSDSQDPLSLRLQVHTTTPDFLTWVLLIAKQVPCQLSRPSPQPRQTNLEISAYQ